MAIFLAVRLTREIGWIKTLKIQQIEVDTETNPKKTLKRLENLTK